MDEENEAYIFGYALCSLPLVGLRSLLCIVLMKLAYSYLVSILTVFFIFRYLNHYMYLFNWRKTFHFAGVASMNITLGVQRIGLLKDVS
jgi:hypothetical protein